MSRPKLRRCLLVLGVIHALIGAAAHAQNLDQGKSAKQLFANTCATCHHSARDLAKGRFRPTLRSCADVEKDGLKSGAVLGKLAGLPVYSSNTGGNRVLMPTSGNGCVIIGTNVQYVPAAAPPPASIVQPGLGPPRLSPLRNSRLNKYRDWPHPEESLKLNGTLRQVNF